MLSKFHNHPIKILSFPEILKFFSSSPPFKFTKNSQFFIKNSQFFHKIHNFFLKFRFFNRNLDLITDLFSETASEKGSLSSLEDFIQHEEFLISEEENFIGNWSELDHLRFHYKE